MSTVTITHMRTGLPLQVSSEALGSSPPPPCLTFDRVTIIHHQQPGSRLRGTRPVTPRLHKSTGVSVSDRFPTSRGRTIIRLSYVGSHRLKASRHRTGVCR